MHSIIRNREQGHAVNQDEGQDAMDVAADEDQDQHLSGENLSDVEAAEITILKKKLHATQKANWRLRQEKTSLKTALEIHKVRFFGLSIKRLEFLLVPVVSSYILFE